MVHRPPGALWGLAIAFFTLGAIIVVGTYAASPLSVLHDVASSLRVPIPGSGEAALNTRTYGLYFGMLNAPTRKMMKVPKLKITIVPPEGIDDPDFVEVPYQVDVLVEGFHTVQVARIAVHAPGTYQVHVESPEENGGSFSIGEPPAMLDAPQALARSAPAILTFFGLSALMTVAAMVFRRGHMS